MYPRFDGTKGVGKPSPPIVPTRQRIRAFSRCKATLGVECCSYLLRRKQKIYFRSFLRTAAEAKICGISVRSDRHFRG